MNGATLRELLGVVRYDLVPFIRQMLGGRGWVMVGNRADRIEVGNKYFGARVAGDPWVSEIHACRIMPWLGRWLLKRAQSAHPFEFAVSRSETGAPPAITFVIPFRGRDRLPQLEWTVRSILGQHGVEIECLVVEQSQEQVVERLPAGARCLHLPHPDGSPAWRKSWAFNVGVAEARAEVVVCHDADIPAPADYAREVLALVSGGYEAVHVQRFLFRLSRPATTELMLRGRVPLEGLEGVWQNWQGGTVAITKEAYWRIGGFDERFVDWGGEDNEFFSRCTLLRQASHGYLPFLHLWHPEQETKHGEARERALAMMRDRLAVPANDRVAELVAARAGQWGN